MDSLTGLLFGISTALDPVVLLYCFAGVFIGTFIGVLPGLGALATISLLLPLTYHVPPVMGFVMLAGVYYGAQYGGSTASILLNLPGTPSNVVTCIDGYQMTQQGRAGPALFMTAASSFVGGMIGVLLLIFFVNDVAAIGLKFGSAEYFSLMCLGLVTASTVATGSRLKSVAMVVVGLLLGTVGTDLDSGVPRFAFGITELLDGVSLVVLAMGLFGFVEVARSAKYAMPQLYSKITVQSMLPTKQDVKRSIAPTLRGSIIGSFFGALPGTGPSIAAFSAYSVEKKFSKNAKKLGTGAIEGVVAPEAANNAAAQTAFIPTLTLGIPGDAIMALMIGALMMHGIQPGPLMIANQPEIFWGLIASFIIGNVFLLILNIPMIGIWVGLLRIPYHYLYPAILTFIALGVYSVNNNVFDIYAVAVIGVAGYMLTIAKFEFAPLLLGFVLGPLIEENLRRALVLSSGSFMTFIERPISAGFLAAILTIAVVVVVKSTKPQT